MGKGVLSVDYLTQLKTAICKVPPETPYRVRVGYHINSGCIVGRQIQSTVNNHG
jgi:hypothetical protein